MLKNITLSIVVLAGLTVAGCVNRLPSKFDSTEYRDLVEMNVLSSWSDSCAQPELDRLDYLGRILKTYSTNTLNSDIGEIYTEISSLATELRARENPSPAYCKLKRTNIFDATEKAIEIFGRRSK